MMDQQPIWPLDTEIFISFRSANATEGNSSPIDPVSQDVADDLSKALERDLGIQTFNFREKMYGGDQIEQKIVNAVQKAKHVICLVSKEYFDSHWCLLEFREAGKQLKRSCFTASEHFDPSQDPLTANVLVPSIARWNGALSHKALNNSLQGIVQNIGRAGLVDLLKIYLQSDGLSIDEVDTRKIDWCSKNQADPFAKPLFERIIHDLLQRRRQSNGENQSQYDKLVMNLTSEAYTNLKAERDFLTDFEQKIKANSHIAINQGDYINLRDQAKFEPALLRGGDADQSTMIEKQKQSIEKLTGDKVDLAQKLGESEGRHIQREEVLKKNIETIKKQHDEIQQLRAKIDQMINAGKDANDEITNALKKYEDYMGVQCATVLKKVRQYRESAHAASHAATELKSEIDSAIQAQRAKYKEWKGYAAHWLPAPQGRAGRFMARYVLDGGNVKNTIHVRRAWGCFDEAPHFVGHGVAEFYSGNEHLFTYFGDLDRFRPKENGYGVLKVTPGFDQRFKSWEGSWSENAAYGRLRYADGAAHFSHFRIPDFLSFVECDHGMRIHGGEPEFGHWNEGAWVRR